MNNVDRLRNINDLFKDCLNILDKKGHDYSGDEDANSNFKILAERLKGRGLDKYNIWFVYFEKHLSAIETFINTRKLESEGIQGRIQGAINYLAILHTLLIEDYENILSLEQLERKNEHI